MADPLLFCYKNSDHLFTLLDTGNLLISQATIKKKLIDESTVRVSWPNLTVSEIKLREECRHLCR